MIYLLKFIIIIFSITTAVYSNVTTKIDPIRLRSGENAFFIISLRTEKSVAPKVSFNIVGASIVQSEIPHKRETLNGFKYTYRYKLITEANANKMFITNFIIDYATYQEKIKDRTYKISSKRVKKNNVFIEADVQKKEVYVGQGLNVNYYLYSKINIVNIEIKKYPKFAGVIKRFNEAVSKNQTMVTINNEIFKKRLVYSLRIFPERIGKVKIDSLKLQIEYIENIKRLLNYGRNRIKRKIVKSRPVIIKALNIPTAGMSENFSGLVGKYDVTLSQNRNRFLVNDVIEFKLVIEGDGLLENYSAPQLISSKDLEEFQTKNELIVNKEKGTATKIIEYTYLGRGQTIIGPTKFEFVYFEPESKQFKSISRTLQQIKIFGKASELKKVEKSKKKGIVLKKDSVVAISYPLLSSNKASILKIINIALVFIVFFIFIKLIIPKRRINYKQLKIKSIIKEIKNDGLNYELLNSLFYNIAKDHMDPKGEDLVQLMNKLNLSPEAKEYFSNLIEKGQQISYGKVRDDVDYRFEKKYFSELSQSVKKGPNESIGEHQ